MNSNISEDYDRIDRYLRNNLGDDDYAEYSASLDAVLAAAPQPVAAEVTKDAARYRCLRRGQHWSVIDGIGDTLRAEVLDAAIDAAMAGTGSDESGENGIG